MYIHLGNDVVISAVDVIAILNIEEPISADLRDVIEVAEIERKLINISKKDKRKALIVCTDRIYSSPISSNTLYKRASHYPKEV
ncbi:MAG: DUF370 domain-containing protein [Firmicutes bacterium HGW-Firmicutes-15]|nr:MAG: DUF370 domain-containing protein [Firmicutes bacterium HGW-Firmicutes-15]